MLGFGKKKGPFILKAPVTGTTLPLEEVPDQAFAEKMLGDGAAIDPTGGEIVAPCDGTVEMIFPTGHALAITTDDGLEVLIHIGINTVEMHGDGFEKIANAGDRVKEGQLLLKFDCAKILASGKSKITPVLITNMEKVRTMRVNNAPQEAGKTNFIEIDLS